MLFYCVFQFHYFIVDSICKPYSSRGTIKIELNCTESGTEWRAMLYWQIAGNDRNINKESNNIRAAGKQAHN